MALILSLETSTHVCSVALHDENMLIATSEVHIEQSHASKLGLLVDQIKKTAGISFDQLSAIAISSGPGSYTGLRIGTSTAKGLCYALGIPLIAINTLDLLAYQVNRFNQSRSIRIPMIDARRMEVYCQVVDADLHVVSPIEAKIIDEFSFIDFLEKEQVFFFGNGSEKCQAVIGHPNATFIKGIYPSAAHLGIMAMHKLKDGTFEDLAGFEPFYLKDFVARKPSVSF